MNITALKSLIDALSAPTISFTILTVIFPFIFPPSDWFEKIHRKSGLWRIWTKLGGVIGMILITAFFVKSIKELKSDPMNLVSSAIPNINGDSLLAQKIWSDK